MLFKEIVDARTDGRTDARWIDDGQWAITKAHPEHKVLRWAKKSDIYLIWKFWAVLKTYFFKPRDLLMQPTGTV